MFAFITSINFCEFLSSLQICSKKVFDCDLDFDSSPALC